MKKFEATPDLIGKYINRYLWTDADPVGKIIGVRGKSFVTIQPIRAGRNKTKMKFEVGGFAGHAINNDQQEYDYFEQGEPYEVRLSNSKMHNMHWAISDKPFKKYDYNF